MTPEIEQLQSTQVAESRLLQQLETGVVNVGQYWGGNPTAAQWRALVANSSLEIPAGLFSEQLARHLSVIDLGPGTGKPISAVLRSLSLTRYVLTLVDTSEAMLQLAAAHLQQQNIAVSKLLVANFFEDATKIASAIPSSSLSRLYVCLGGTAGNFPLSYSLDRLCSQLDDGDHLLLGLGLYDTNTRQLLEDAEFYRSERNCRFGLSWLRQLGVEANHQHASTVVEPAPEGHGVQVVRGFFRFPNACRLQGVEFAEGESIQFVETRRFVADKLSELFDTFGLRLVAQHRLQRQGLFLVASKAFSEA